MSSDEYGYCQRRLVQWPVEPICIRTIHINHKPPGFTHAIGGAYRILAEEITFESPGRLRFLASKLGRDFIRIVGIEKLVYSRFGLSMAYDQPVWESGIKIELIVSRIDAILHSHPLPCSP